MHIKVYFALLVLCAAQWPITSLAQEQLRTVPTNPAQIQLSYAPVVKQVAPAVVNIVTKRTVTARTRSPFANDPFFNFFFRDDVFGGRMKRRVESALGSGVIVEPDGLVITNEHVIREAEEITVVLNDGREFEAEILVKDSPSDIAMLKVDTKGELLPFASLKPSETLEVGDIVLAIGNPFGVGQTVTSGVVSATGRSSLNINDFNFFIQTDAAINPGNSGGPLVALDGGIVGINTAIFSRDGGSLGIGFAIPSEMVASIITAQKMGFDLSKGVVRPWLGFTGQNVTADIADSLGLPRPRGVLVADIHPASPFKEAGIEEGDIILSMNGREIRDAGEMKFRIATVALGDFANFESVRRGESRTVKVQAIAPPDDPPREETFLDEGRHPLLGTTVANLNPAVMVELGLGAETNIEEGVVITDIDPRSPAIRFFDVGDIILDVNGREIEDVGDLDRAIGQTARGWEIVFSRGGRVQQLVLR